MGVLKLLYLVLKSGIHPAMWNMGLISPTFNNRDSQNPSNYRVVCNLGTCSILDSRILSYLSESNILSKSQISFLHKHTDHIFTLHILIQKHVHQKKRQKYMHALLISEKLLTRFDLIDLVHQGCNKSPTLFNIYISQLSKLLENSQAPGGKGSVFFIQTTYYSYHKQNIGY